MLRCSSSESAVAVVKKVCQKTFKLWVKRIPSESALAVVKKAGKKTFKLGVKCNPKRIRFGGAF